MGEAGAEGEEGPMTSKGFFGLGSRGEGVSGLELGLQSVVGLGFVQVSLGVEDKGVAVGDEDEDDNVFLEKKEVICRC